MTKGDAWQELEEKTLQLIDVYSKNELKDFIADLKAEVKKMDTLITKTEVLEVIDKVLKGDSDDNDV